MTLDVFVVEKVIPALDAAQKAQSSAETLYTVTNERGEDVNFRLVKDLAGGASARIFKSYTRDRNALKPIAIKRIESEGFKGFEDEFQQLLDRERTALKELQKYKDFVTEYYGSFYYEPGDEHWLAMEFCDGASVYALAPYIYSTKESTRKQFNRAFPAWRKHSKANVAGLKISSTPKSVKCVNFKQVAAIAAGALRGLEVIHKAGFIHGDIKSGNILLCYPGIVKICDFGLTSKVKGVPNPDYHALGTLDYMAPEQMLKSLALDHGRENPERYKYNHKIDVWALGIIILELVLGRTPLSDLRRLDEDEFSFFIANMCKTRLKQNKGSALGFLFYLPQYHEDLMQGNWQIKDRDLLLKRVPELKKNQRFLLDMLMRPKLYNKRPNPAHPAKTFINQNMFAIDKCLDFIAHCLFIKYSWRPDARQMQNHPFVLKQCKELIRLDGKYETLSNLQRNRGERKKVWRKFACSLTVHEIHKILEKHSADEKERVYKETL